MKRLVRILDWYCLAAIGGDNRVQVKSSLRRQLQPPPTELMRPPPQEELEDSGEWCVDQLGLPDNAATESWAALASQEMVYEGVSQHWA